MKLTICDDGYVAEIKSDEDFELFLEMMQVQASDDVMDYCFENDKTGERIFVEEPSLDDAYGRLHEVMADDEFKEWIYVGAFTVDEAEEIGYDTY